MNKKIQKIMYLILGLSCIFLLIGCNQNKKAETTVNNMLTAFKNLDFEEVKKYVNLEDITSSSQIDSTENYLLVMEAISGNLSYEIISSEEIDSNNVTVKTKITVIDIKPVLRDFFGKALEYFIANAFISPQPTEEEIDKKMEEFLVECVSKPDLATVTNEIDINVVKNENNEWKIESDETLINALFGGILDAAKELESSFNTEE